MVECVDPQPSTLGMKMANDKVQQKSNDDKGEKVQVQFHYQ